MFAASSNPFSADSISDLTGLLPVRKPLPQRLIVIRSLNRSRALCSLQRRCFINCMINTLSPAPAALKARPNAAVVLPLPLPVYTCMYPLRIVGKFLKQAHIVTVRLHGYSCIRSADTQEIRAFPYQDAFVFKRFRYMPCLIQLY